MVEYVICIHRMAVQFCLSPPYIYFSLIRRLSDPIGRGIGFKNQLLKVQILFKTFYIFLYFIFLF